MTNLLNSYHPLPVEDNDDIRDEFDELKHCEHGEAKIETKDAADVRCKGQGLKMMKQVYQGTH